MFNSSAENQLLVEFCLMNLLILHFNHSFAGDKEIQETKDDL